MSDISGKTDDANSSVFLRDLKQWRRVHPDDAPRFLSEAILPMSFHARRGQAGLAKRRNPWQVPTKSFDAFDAGYESPREEHDKKPRARFIAETGPAF